MRKLGIFAILFVSAMVLSACAPGEPTGNAAGTPEAAPQEPSGNPSVPDAPAEAPEAGDVQDVEPVDNQPQQTEQPEIDPEEIEKINQIEQDYIEEHGEEAAMEMTPEEVRELFEEEGVDPEVIDMILPQ